MLDGTVEGTQARPKARTFEDPVAWQKAHSLTLGVYSLTARFPREEAFTLIPQFRRAAISVPANIAEGFRRSTVQEKKRFYNIAQSSLEECRYYLLLARDLGYGDTQKHTAALEQVRKLLNALMNSLSRRTVGTSSLPVPVSHASPQLLTTGY